MSKPGILLSFYADDQEAAEALRDLRRKRFRRAALVHKSNEGRLRIVDVAPRRGVLWGLALGLLLAVSIVLLSVELSPGSLFESTGYLLMAILGAVGLLVACGMAGWLYVRLFELGVDDELVERCTRWLVTGETLIVVQADPASMGRAIRVLRSAGETQPSIFALRPQLEGDGPSEPVQGEPLTNVQLQDHARRLAAGHRLAEDTGHEEPLLRLLERCSDAIESVRDELAEASRLEQTVSTSAEWLLDNAYIMQGQINDVRLNLPKRYYHELPVLAGGSHRGEPRIYHLAAELILHTDARLTRQNIVEFLAAYQEASPLKMGELWAFPLMLRIALIDVLRKLSEQVDRRLREREYADFWANRLLAASRRGEPRLLFAVLGELTEEQAVPSAYFAFQLTGHLYDEEAALVPVKAWLERQLANPLPDVITAEQSRQAADQVSIGNAITSLRHLSLLDWRDIFEQENFSERVLRRDPAGVYAKMDFATRDSYRHAVEEIARVAGVGEQSVAELAVELATDHPPDDDGDVRRRHVGYYLAGDGRELLTGRLACRERRRRRVLQWVYRRHTPLYLGALALVTLILAGVAAALEAWAGAGPWMTLVLGLAALLPASQFAIQAVNYIVTRLLPPCPLPKLSFEQSGIPDEYRTLVVVPMMLVSEQAIRNELQKLEIRYLANPDANLVYGLFSDYTDADEQHHERDHDLLRVATEGIEDLQSRYGAARFYLFHREREWCETEGRWIGWERKRGKLEELNRLLNGEQPRQVKIVYAGDEDALADVRFVITLDADTQLPRDSARRLVETIAHPLNQPRLASDGETVIDGYTIIQPRVSTSLPSATATPYSRLFTDPIGTDPYTTAVSDVYQDLAGEGSYIGKGIYDPRAFHAALTDQFPEETLLSHDLIEGAHVRAALASDIELFDDFPPDYITQASRQHRWTRGDWQIAGWCLPTVPGPEGKRIKNPLSPLNRWKIFDNLRRSLVPAASVLFLALAWLLSPRVGALASGLIALLMFFPPILTLITALTTRKGLANLSWAQHANEMRRSLAEIALLPHQAALMLDAIYRVAWRKLISRRHLLEWTTAQAAAWKAVGRTRGLVLNMLVITGLAVGLALAIGHVQAASLPAALPFLLLWLVSPLIGWRLNVRPKREPRRAQIPRSDLQMLREVARRTWRYFDDFVGPETYWLPPDNYQVSHRNELAPRTSPTNIGLWMLSVLGANDFGYITPDDVIGRVGETFRTLGELERHEGHLLNWYDLQTLRPLQPRYVSSVDSGNLLGCLWTLEQGMEELISRPLLDATALAGLNDTLQILREVLERTGRSNPRADHAVEVLSRQFADPPRQLGKIVNRLRRSRDPAEMLAAALRQDAPPEDEAAYWAEQIHRQVSAWHETIERYLAWAELLAAEPEDTLMLLGHGATQAQRRALGDAPTLRQLAAGRVSAVHALMIARKRTGELPRHVSDWLDRVDEAFGRAQWLAGEMLAQAEELVRRSRALGDGCNMKFLYDGDRRLFTIGMNVDQQRLDTSFYDLLASEARLGSFVAIARGDVPSSHWLAMGRPFAQVGSRRVLMSWSGTMFEYLMPGLLQKTYDNSLLDQATRQAVAVQRDFARGRDVPWGISESAFSDLDANRTYQYKAFGVPGLGLKRGLDEDLVVAPYATMLALAVDATSSIRNLRRLGQMSLTGTHGYFEAIDFSRQRRGGERGVIVHAYMAHHQAMGFLAICNLVHDNVMQHRFHADPRVKATEPLLYERIPVSPPLYEGSAYERRPSGAMPAELAPSASRFDTPHTPTPKTQLLCNGRYALMVTNSGGGYSRWQDRELTRWRADTTTDRWGSFCYIRDTESHAVWSNAWHPTAAPAGSYNASLHVDRVEIRRSDGEIDTETEIIVSPEDDAEIRRITLVNRSGRVRTLEVTSYFELAMAEHQADRQHPAFNRMFVQTEFLPQRGALLATRRLRDPDDPPIWVAHLLTFEGPARPPTEFETDREQFIGRGRSVRNPIALDRSHERLTNSEGHVLDPILSLRRRVKLQPGQRIHFSLILGATDSRESAEALIDKYTDPQAIARALDLAWTHAQLELRHLRIQPDEARRFQQLASHMLYPNDQLRPPGDRLRQNKLAQARLWPHGIGGDLPIAAVTIGEARDISLVRQALQAHTYWRRHGLVADLVILNEESSSYDQPLHEQLGRLIQAHSMYTGTDQPGGVFLRTVDQLPDEDVTLLLTVARVSLVAARGPLAQQLAAPIEPAELPPLLPTRRVAEEPSAPLPFMELPYFNGIGGFTDDGREYAIYLGPGDQTPAPWINVMANEHFGALVSESGSGFAWAGNSQTNRLTGWSNDPVCDPAGEAIYIRDEETGSFWTPTPQPIRELDAYRCRHGAGYSVFEHNSHAIDQELITFVPVDNDGGLPVRVQQLKLTNESSRPRRLSVTFYAELTLGENREETQLHVTTSFDSRTRGIFARNPYHPAYGERVTFAAMSPAPESHTGDRAVFLGRNGTTASPAAMTRSRLSQRVGAGLDPCAALQVKVELAPGQSAILLCLLGQAESTTQAREIIAELREPHQAADALNRTSAWWDGVLGAVQVKTPELSVDFLLNRWLVYQSLSCRVWGRSAFYQSGGAFGFRDQLQDVVSLLHTRADLAREHILRAAGRQFPEGDVQHWWHPPGGAGIRSRCSDDLLWLPWATWHYVRATGDKAILDEEAPFIDGRPLEDDEQEAYLEPTVSPETASLYEHCRRAVEKGLTAGPHGLPLIGLHDWNDGMNRVGVEGKGESVWLAWFLVEVLEGFAELSEQTGRAEQAAAYRKRAKELAATVEKEAWDGAWYRRAYFDDGTPVGSAGSAEAQIDSLPQSWAVICGAGRQERAAEALASAWERLVLEEEGLALLFTPPFDKSHVNPGYIKGYPPGVRENGGQYTHAACWLAMAAARGGQGGKAVRLMTLMNPVEHARAQADVKRYAVEPYVVAADVYRLPGRTGRGGWTWYTGSAGWMYRVWVEEILGLRVEGNTLRMQPRIPSDWEGFTMRYVHADAIYEITVENPDGVQSGVARVEMDGRRMEDGAIPLESHAIRHRVTVRMGRTDGGNGRRTDTPAAEVPAGESSSMKHRRPSAGDARN